jgi:hypothetical protein
MPQLRVYLYEKGKQTPFNHLSGQEYESIQHALNFEGDLNDDDGAEYATLEAEADEISKIQLNKKYKIDPLNYGLGKWKRPVEVEYRKAEGGRRRKTHKTRKTRKHTRKTRKV